MKNMKTNTKYLSKSLMVKGLMGFLALGGLQATLIAEDTQETPFQAVEEKTTVQVMPDGSKLVQNADGTTIQIDTDGSKTVTKSDGTSVQIKTDGTKVIKDTD